ncbi:MAG: capsule assembly Wzi family protein [Treponema sp.]|nr:capsule assembly Wzi family protein [Treponema sp.]
MNAISNNSLRPVFLAFCVFFGGSVFAVPFDMILSADPVLEDVRFLSLESGRPFLSFTPPLAPAEIERFLDSIDTSLLSAPALQAYDRARSRLVPEARLSFTSDTFSAFLNIHSTVEGKVRFNTDLDWHPRHPDIAPMVSFPFRFFFADVVQLYLEPFFAVGILEYKRAGRFGTNLHYNVERDIDGTFPHRAFLAAGGSWWNFQLGRDHLFWGTGHTGSFSFSGDAQYFEYARLSFFSERVKYSFIVNQMPLRLTGSMYGGNLAERDFTRTTQRHFYLSRLDVVFRDTVSIGIMEGRMTGNSPLHIRYINPLMMFALTEHDLASSFFSLEANWNAARRLSIYGQFVMTDFAFPGGGSGRPPSGLGFMAGLNFAHAINTWGSVFFLEYTYASPYLYMSQDPFSSFIQMNKLDVGSVQHYFTGFPRDTIALTFGARFFNDDTLSLEGRLSWLSRGGHATGNESWTWTQSPLREIALSGVPENNYIASFTASWRPFTHIGFNGSVTGIFSRSNNNNPERNIGGGQASFSVTFQY